MIAGTKYTWLYEKEEKPEHLPCLELQEVVNLSEFYLLLQSAILYGLMTGDPESIDQDKCIHYLELGKRHKVFPVKGWLPSKEFLIGMGFVTSPQPPPQVKPL